MNSRIKTKQIVNVIQHHQHAVVIGHLTES
jgi:hypothetical protein